MIYKLKIKDKNTGEEDFVIMGDSYKSFKEHLINIIDCWTEKWHYETEDKHSKCFGRTLKKEILEIWYTKDKFVSFGGLKMSYEKNYDVEVEKHNKSESYKACKYLKDINWKIKEKKFIDSLLESHRIITEEELCNIKQSGRKGK